ncbi:MAG TPA: hypothetical protein VNT30_05455 [Stellaceae bacterium]|nr:hypothetical protein [Stellaceae bacterium]
MSGRGSTLFWTLLTTTGCLMAACQPLPHPLAGPTPPQATAILTLPDSVGVVVPPVRNAPPAPSAALSAAVADAFRKADIPASTTTGNRRSLRLIGDASGTAVTGDQAAIRIQWNLVDADGKTVGSDLQQRTMTATDWAQATPEMLAGMAQGEVAVLSAMVQGTAPVEVKPVHRVVVRPVTGAPGDGAKSLTRAIAFALQKVSIDVIPAGASTPTDGVLAVQGDVLVEAARPGQQHVVITWSVLRPDGSVAGQVKQDNTIPQGSLDGIWGEIALAIGNAAADGIAEVVNRAPISGAVPPGVVDKPAGAKS